MKIALIISVIAGILFILFFTYCAIIVADRSDGDE